MDSEHKTQLQDAQIKLTEFRNRLDFLVQSVWGSRSFDASDVLIAVNELQSLVEWAAQQPDIGPESAVLVMQLSELHKIRQNLEKSPTDVEGHFPSQLIDEQRIKLTDESESNSKELLDLSDVIDANATDGSSQIHQAANDTDPCNHMPFFEYSSGVEDLSTFISNNETPIGDTTSFNFKKDTEERNLEIKIDHNANTQSLFVTENDTEAQDLLSNGIELLLKSNAEIQDLLLRNSEMLKNSNIEIQDLLSSSSDVLVSSGIEMGDLISSGTEAIKNNTDIFSKEIDYLRKPNTEVHDLLLDDIDIISKSDINVFTNDFDILIQPTAELLEVFSNESAVASKSDSKVKDIFYNDFDNLIRPSSELQVMSSNDTSKSDTKMQDAFFNDFDILSQPITVIRDDSIDDSNSDTRVKYDLSNNLTIWNQPNTKILETSLNGNTNVSKDDKEDLCSNKNDELSEATLLSLETGVDAKTSAMILDLLSSNETISTKKSLEVDDFISHDSISSIKPLKNEVIILETNEDDKTTEWVNDPKSSNDPLDICMFAIRNLYDSLRIKENELLKLSVMQNDQKHIDALQGVIIDFHKDITNLNTQLDKTKKENNQLKEQVLELEEAENDARLEAQKLEQKLVFLQEKDSHSQTEICHLKQSLKKSSEKISEKERIEKEISSQIKYLETLVQKYEDQIKCMEEKTPSKIDTCGTNDSAGNEKALGCERGTQTYPWQAKLDSNIFLLNGTPSSDTYHSESLSQTYQISKNSQNEPSETEVEKYFSNRNVLPVGEAISMEAQFIIADKDGITQRELNERLHKLMNEDVGLQQQIHNIDQINLDLWKKLQHLETNIGDCKRKDINETDLTVCDNEGNRLNGGASITKAAELSDSNQKNNIPTENINYLNQSDKHIKERLSSLEEINVSFEKELKTRENICKEQGKKYEEWKKTEKRLISDLKFLVVQRDSLINLVEKLKSEKEKLEQQVIRQQSELNDMKEKHQLEVSKLKSEQEEMTMQLHHKVNQLITKEKDLLKMIKNLKSERNKNQDKSELERFKSNYIQLQLELSNSREDIRKLEESFKFRIKECESKHTQEETRLIKEIECLKHENMRCDDTIRELQLKQHDLINALDQKEKELLYARESFKKSLEDTEQVHRSVETELKSRLQKVEEGTVMVTTVLMEERTRVEKELQDNIQDLRSKEVYYKAKIAELEQDVTHLHEELHKVSEESEINVQRNSDSEKQKDKNNEVTPVNSLSNNIGENTHSSDKTGSLGSDLKPLRGADDVALLAGENKLHISKDIKDDVITTKAGDKDENVEHLRVQVRELQAQLEKISDEVSEISPVPLGPAITAPCMGLQKEELDYAEVDECVAEWRKPALNSMPTKSIPQHYQPVYVKRYPSRYRNQDETKKASVQRESQCSEENDYDEVLPRPTNFHIVQQVGQDTLLVGWNYVNPSVLEGFEVYLDNRVHERIYIPDRTKALLSGLNLRRPLNLSICALSRYGQVSEPTTLESACHSEMNSRYLEEEDNEYRDLEDSFDNKHRPYSMEW